VNRVLIFDCDGVLVDSEKLSCRAWIPVLKRHGVSATLAEIEQFIGRSDQDLLAHFRLKSGLGLPDDLMSQREAEYFALARNSLRLFPGVSTVLDELGLRGARLAVASSSRPPKLQFNLAQAHVAEYFEVVCSSIEVARGKPAPDLFLRTAQRLGVKPQTCVVVEDSPYGIQAAIAAEMAAIGFTSSHDAEVLRSSGAHAVFSDYRDFLALLAEMPTDRQS
jgi:HAD superfamily hydrolase (TIGR01509 family)